jgi:hypothetical protein
MTPDALLAYCRAAGLSLSVDGPDLVVKPVKALTPELRAQLVANKPMLLLILSAEPHEASIACAGCGSTSWAVALIVDGDRRQCHGCARGRVAARSSGTAVGGRAK